jgi:hypothetical protein
MQVITLSQNELTGDISFMQNMLPLSQAFMSRNQLTGSLNFTLPPLLSVLTASANQLSGPCYIDGLTLLESLVLSVNSISSMVLQNMPSFYTLQAGSNAIVNVTMQNLPNCITIDLESNLITRIPAFVYYGSSLPRLYTLSLKSMCSCSSCCIPTLFHYV